MTSQAMLEAGSVPLLLFHLLEWFGADYELDVAAYTQQWLRAERLASWSQMILEHTSEEPVIVYSAPQTGIWRMRSDGTLQFVRSAFQPGAITLRMLSSADFRPARGWSLSRPRLKQATSRQS